MSAIGVNRSRTRNRACSRNPVAVDRPNEDCSRLARRPIFGDTEVAKRVGLDPSRNLGQACSDFYLLSYLRRPHYVVAAAEALDELVRDLAPEFALYLDMACGGELRHASTWPCELPSCPVLGRGNDRSVAWRDWLAWKTPTYRAEYAANAFEEASWPSRNYGGEPWALIATTLHEFLNKQMSCEMFIDRVWNLQHHGGIVLNKIYPTDELALVSRRTGRTITTHSSHSAASRPAGCGPRPSPREQGPWKKRARRFSCGHDLLSNRPIHKARGAPMAKGKRKKGRNDHLMVDDRIAVLYGGCNDIGDEPDQFPSPYLQPGMRPAWCRHWRQQVKIEPGVIVHASAYMDRPRSDDWDWPDIGVYLSERWIEEMPMASFYWAGPTLGPRSQVALLPCPDGGWPLYEQETRQVLAYALEAARAGRFVEVGCHAGHGRTGMALATLMILAGHDAETAMLRDWNEYCEQAIEIGAQVQPNLCKGRPETHSSSPPRRPRDLSRRERRAARDVAKAAMHRVWDEYCPHGIETEAQERYLYALAARVCRETLSHSRS